MALALVGLAALAPRGGEVVVATTPDGRFRIEREVRDEAGRQVLHGEHRRWYAGTRQLAAQGRYEDDLQEGEWTWWWPDGEVRMRGAYSKGRRTGKWELFHPDGRRAGVGKHRLGLRDDVWVYFDADGAKRDSESGLYRMESELWPNRQRRFAVETNGGVRHGVFEAWWPDGTPMLTGRYARGARAGWWSFRLVDGMPDAQLVSGWYEDGERVADAAPEGPDDPWAVWEELPGPEPEGVEREPPAPGRSPGVKSAERADMRAALRRFAQGDEEARAKAEAQLLRWGRPVASDVLERLRALDLADEAQGALGERLTQLLARIAGGDGFGWRASSADEDRAANRWALARWLSWWELVREDDAWWELRAHDAHVCGRELLCIDLLDPSGVAVPPRGPAVANLQLRASPLLVERFKARRIADRDARAAVEAGLAWLVAHQAPDGRWDSDGFAAACGRLGGAVCSGAGQELHDEGLTGLALLALLGEGDAATHEAHGRAIASAISWLLLQQDAESGGIGKPLGHSWMYEHAIATAALAQASHVTDSPVLGQAVERAVRLIEKARNPGAGWRYEPKPNGENDTSVTGWMVAALRDAERAGVAVDPKALPGAIAWIDLTTDTGTGRVGYDSRGSLSSRVVHVNDNYPADAGEAMTAVGLWCRKMAGQDIAVSPISRGIGLLLAKLPAPDASGLTSDLYYWYHGTCALHVLGGERWDRWYAALLQTLRSTQCREGDARGSWDPIGPWSFAGGRIYSTALATLALQTPWRCIEDAPKRR